MDNEKFKRSSLIGTFFRCIPGIGASTKFHGLQVSVWVAVDNATKAPWLSLGVSRVLNLASLRFD